MRLLVFVIAVVLIELVLFYSLIALAFAALIRWVL